MSIAITRRTLLGKKFYEVFQTFFSQFLFLVHIGIIEIWRSTKLGVCHFRNGSFIFIQVAVLLTSLRKAASMIYEIQEL